MRQQSTDTGRSVRLLRVGEQIRHALSEVLARGNVQDDVLTKHLVTVTEVRVSPDLRHATVFVVPLGGTDEPEVMAALRRNARYLKGEVGHRLRTMKYTPNLVFRVDESFDEASKIDSLLRNPRVAQDLGRYQVPEDDDEDGEDTGPRMLSGGGTSDTDGDNRD